MAAFVPLVTAWLAVAAPPVSAPDTAWAVSPPSAADSTEDAAEPDPAPPAEAPSSSQPGPQPDPSLDSGIDFAPPPPPTVEEPPLDAPPRPTPLGPAEPPSPDDEYSPLYGTSIGRAPPDGMGAIVAGALLLPTTALVTTLFVGSEPLTGIGDPRVSVVVASTGLSIVGVGILSLGAYRLGKNRRWARIRGVDTLPQGGGMTSGGAVLLNFGIVSVVGGVLVFASNSTTAASRVGATMIGGGAVALGAAAPLIVFGRRRAQAYTLHDGWARRPLPPIPVSPSAFLLPHGGGVGIQGRF